MTFYIGVAVFLGFLFVLAGRAQWMRRRSLPGQFQGRDYDMETKAQEQSLRNSSHPDSGGGPAF